MSTTDPIAEVIERLRVAMKADDVAYPNMRTFNASKNDVAQLIAEVASLREEAIEADQLREQMAYILDHTANALKGPPEPLSRHSWHDLAGVAAAAATDAAHWRKQRQESEEFAARMRTGIARLRADDKGAKETPDA